MRTNRAVLAAALVWASAACSGSVATSTLGNPNLTPQMREWRTYSWLSDPTSGDAMVQNDIVRARVKEAVERELGLLGYQRVAEKGDFEIGWNAAIEERVDVDWGPDYYGYGYRAWYDDYDYAPYVDEYSEGTLILDFVDAGSDELAWRGVAEGRLGGYGPELPSASEIKEAVHEILEEFPLRAQP